MRAFELLITDGWWLINPYHSLISVSCIIRPLTSDFTTPSPAYQKKSKRYISANDRTFFPSGGNRNSLIKLVPLCLCLFETLCPGFYSRILIQWEFTLWFLMKWVKITCKIVKTWVFRQIIVIKTLIVFFECGYPLFYGMLNVYGVLGV